MTNFIKSQQAKAREELAKSIYGELTYTGDGQKPKWVNGGNSLKQEEARRMALKLGTDQIIAQTIKDTTTRVEEEALKEAREEYSRSNANHSYLVITIDSLRKVTQELNSLES